MPTANVYMARHGQTAYNLERRFQGQLPVPLDETGRRQAAELAERVDEHGFSALWCSTLQRARETAEVVAERLGMEIAYDARLAETDAGDWTDLLFSEVQAQAPELFAKFLAGDPSFAFPGGESFAQQEERVASALQDVEAGALPALVICHGMVIRAALSTRAGRWQAHAERVPNGALVALDPALAPPADLGGTVTQAS
ncbi:MAG TPA: histidine phosphatase family protein [Solirubrobacteraceae bacterium]|nr:histidine phosphatase family protein [Solirubrobacteraceae bacterium]